jgi:hypothetical protein
MHVIANSLARGVDLEQQMLELLALRRALCLAKACRNRPVGSRRRLRPSSLDSARGRASRRGSGLATRT